MQARARVRQGVLVVTAFAALAAGSGCNNAGEGMFSGAGLGAGAGAILGAIAGDAGAGAAIGAVSGAVLGGIIGDQNERNSRPQYQVRYEDRRYYDPRPNYDYDNADYGRRVDHYHEHHHYDADR